MKIQAPPARQKPPEEKAHPKPEQHGAIAVGNGPPEDVPSSELAATLQTLPFPHKLVDYPRHIPGTDKPIGKIAIVPATMRDKINAQAAAHIFTEEVLKDPKKAEVTEDRTALGYVSVFKNAVSIELLFRTCRVHDKLAEPAFPGTRWMRKFLTDDEVGVLTAKWLRVQMEIGPIISLMTDAECDLWIEKLIEGGSSDPLGGLASDAKTDLIMRLAWHLRNSRTDSSSSGEQPESGSTGTDGSVLRSDHSDAVPPAVEMDDEPLDAARPEPDEPVKP